MLIFSSSYKIFVNIDLILSHNTHLKKFKRIEIIYCLTSNSNKIELNISNRKINGKYQYTWKLNNIPLKYILNKNAVKEENSKSKNYFSLIENENALIKMCGMQQKQYLEGNIY